MRTRRIHLGISPCPNDTFAFHGLLTGAIETPGIDLEIELADVQALNAKLRDGMLDASKASFYAALHLSAETIVLRAGSALGFGVGPLLLKRKNAPPMERARVLSPGEWTTAHLLLRLFHDGEGAVEHVSFAEILPALARGDADYGVCIHEGRFTYPSFDLELVEDLGTTWERETQVPLPLGGILARRTLGTETLHALDDAIRASLDFARRHPVEALATMKAHAQELDERVIQSHVDLYVNEHTRDLGDAGESALHELSRRARAKGLVAADAPELEIAAAQSP